MICDVCNDGNLEDYCNDELVCPNCGAVYDIKYRGCYPYDDGGLEYFDEGFEPKDWKDKYMRKVE